jgi:hypothetical protein
MAHGHGMPFPYKELGLGFSGSFFRQRGWGPLTSFRGVAGGNYIVDCKRSTDTKRSKQQIGITLIARLVQGEETHGEALAAAFFVRLKDDVVI